MHSQLVCEADAYNVKHPRRIPPAGASNYPMLSELYAQALKHYTRQPKQVHFICAGEAYGIVWVGVRMCVILIPIRNSINNPFPTGDALDRLMLRLQSPERLHQMVFKQI